MTATRTETRLADTPASVVVLSRDVIESTPAATSDDMLRQVPGFSLFRRAGSRVANPTTQGVTLRGVGASGASRALVLDDGIPLNDPFGGWVYWGRIARPSLERVEVLRGGASDLYGSGAMGGVIQFIRRRDPALSAEISGGSQETLTGSVFASLGRDVWRGAVAIDAFDTAGHILVEPESRGAVDVAADSEHLAAEVSVHRNSAFLRLSHYDESRNNGTPLQVNDTTIRQLAGGFDSALAGGRVGARGWIGDQDYHQTFSAIFSGRTGERLTNVQDIPSNNAGASAQWTRGFANTHALLAGAEVRRVEALDREQGTTAAFIEDVMVLAPSLSVTAGLRFDAWEGRDAWSPRVAVLYQPSRGPSWTASAYRAFRAPTLNELYRDFRVGNVITLANESLGGETVTGLEIGARGNNIRATLFWMELDELISNVTLTVTPSLITRQRQ
ncbi:MAG TPA: TonB-dependent receptor, partial [Thermoanaerobaculia bacterium]